MKRISITLLLAVLMLGSCGFMEDNLISGPTNLQEQGSFEVSFLLKMGAATPDSVDLQSNFPMKDDSTGTEYRTVRMGRSIEFEVPVSQGDHYYGRVIENGKVYYDALLVNGTETWSWDMHETYGPYFHGDIDLDGNFVQGENTLVDTIVVPIRVYGPSGHSCSFNGSGTGFDNRSFMYNPDSGYYELDFTTLAGIQKYDWWGSWIDSVAFGTAMIYYVTGDYIRFAVNDELNIEVLDSLSSSYNISWHDSTNADTVSLMLDDSLGERSFDLVYSGEEWQRHVVLPSGSLIHLRIQVDGDPQFLGVYLLGDELHYLVDDGSGSYYFEFYIDEENGRLIQAESNIWQIITFENP